MRFRNIKTLAAVAVAFTMLPLSALAQGTMFVTGNKVGIGVDTPTELLHLKSGAAEAELKMRLEQTQGAQAWAYSVVDNGGLPGRAKAFRISLQGSGGPEFDMIGQGDPGGASTLKVFGSIDATAFNVTSSRELKTDFEAIDTTDVLDRVAQLEMTSWRYKNGAPGTHIGPMAEDWADAFELGSSDKTISIVDASGVALAAIQGLYSEVQDRDEKIEQLSGQVADLQALVEQLVEQ